VALILSAWLIWNGLGVTAKRAPEAMDEVRDALEPDRQSDLDHVPVGTGKEMASPIKSAFGHPSPRRRGDVAAVLEAHVEDAARFVWARAPPLVGAERHHPEGEFRHPQPFAPEQVIAHGASSPRKYWQV
jgi:hypothetical protein